MRTILSAALALSVLSAVAATPASAKSHPDPRNPAVEIPSPSQY